MGSSSRSDPDLAFVIPARNEARFIASAIRSIVDQTVPAERLEVVVVENGSADDTAEAARRALAPAPALRGAIITQTTASIPVAKNRGAKAATAPILIFLDADSRAAPELAQHVLDWAERGYPAGSIKIVADSTDWLDRGFFGLIEWGKGLFGIHANMLYCERDLFLRSRVRGRHSTGRRPRIPASPRAARGARRPRQRFLHCDLAPPAPWVAVSAWRRYDLCALDARPCRSWPTLALLKPRCARNQVAGLLSPRPQSSGTGASSRDYLRSTSLAPAAALPGPP